MIEETIVDAAYSHARRRMIVASASGVRVERDLVGDPDPNSGERNNSTRLYHLAGHLYAAVSYADCIIVDVALPSMEACPRPGTDGARDMACVFRSEVGTWGLMPDPSVPPSYLGRFDWLNGSNDEGEWTNSFRYQSKELALEGSFYCDEQEQR